MNYFDKNYDDYLMDSGDPNELKRGILVGLRKAAKLVCDGCANGTQRIETARFDGLSTYHHGYNACIASPIHREITQLEADKVT